MARQFRISALKVLLFLMLFSSQAMAQDQCKKDLLLIVDTSFTVGETNFNKQIKPFLNQLINAPVLNVGEDGTHIAIMLFSHKDKTKIELPFNEVYNKDALNKIITKLDWDKVKGSQTRTDIALQKASEIFPSKSPANHRKNIEDAIVIITDGKPQGITTAADVAMKYAQDLKNNEVAIIGVGVGEITKPENLRILQNISSPGQTITATFVSIKNIVGQLVNKSCQSYSAIGKGQCKKDLLLVVDTSSSIGATNFNKQIKPFLNQLINEPVLNVGQDGTHIALMLFSHEDKTKMVIRFDQEYNKDNISKVINDWDWYEVEGTQTRTDIALQKASETIFSSKSPGNYRKAVDDAIVIITDGKPQGTTTAADVAMKYAQDLKDNEVAIIGVGVGEITKPENWRILQNISSPGQTIKATFDSIKNIVGQLVNKSCQSYSDFYCTCPRSVQGSGVIYLKPGETKIIIYWIEPIPSCPGGKLEMDTTKTIVKPLLRSPHAFEAGNHSISYMYFFKNESYHKTCFLNLEIKAQRNFSACRCPPLNLGLVFVEPGASTGNVSWQLPQPQCPANLKAITPEVKPGDSFSIGPHTVNYVFNIEGNFDVTCKVNFNVTEGIYLCRGKPFSRSSQKCCCGVIHEKQTGFRCCGIDYYETSRVQCCAGGNVRNKEESCFEPCKCPSIPLIIKYKKPGETNAVVGWELPKPNCENRLVNVVPSVSPGGTFPIGLHNIKYSYKIFNRYDAICQVDIEVKECKCPPLYLPAISVKPGALTVKVHWREPRPDCPEVSRKTEPQRKPGEAFTIGKHKIRYVYNIDNKFDLVCQVTFQVKGAICRDKGFDIAIQECCCGTIYHKIPGFRCCEQDYYEIATQKCCDNSVVRNKDVSCPTQ